MPVVRFGVSLPKDIANQFDTIIKQEGYENRSKAIYDLIKDFITKKKWEAGKQIAGIISILYDHHEKTTVNNLLDIQHDFHDIIISSQHIHLDHDNCFEVIIVKGESIKINELYKKLKFLKNIKQTNLTIADLE
ncbi:nickel responsive regulator [Deferribacter desulfuricans SSM1]|uniref:Putative nickel-responsive regulator n=1 Tax=Deferribacter desulfuricans (strain DSM 14783 / JCM 11476 / NBRC 101012 / SSM1) TaxID=639282 RepID=D3P9K2_DEFDS|nr:nickel-responsive transcriptional regulator NikR [Deferribacter desulfuricans]BAI81392.1 nickel responsive regulator [Deferribacter desulfuricans SSM1]